MDLDELTIREHVRDLIGRYTRAGDSGRFADLAALFAPDGVLLVPDEPPFVGPAAVLGYLERVAANLAAETDVPMMHHHVSSIWVDVVSPTDVRAGSYYLVVTERGPDHWGRYRDRFALGRDGWYFAERRVRTDGATPTSWVATRRSAP